MLISLSIIKKFPKILLLIVYTENLILSLLGTKKQTRFDSH